MPTLHWLTRDEDLKRSAAVPYRLLEADPTLSFGDQAAGNMLIQGDNLDALKALLPYHAGQVRCIFIDPPYNTKSAFTQYDDNLEHSLWLATIYPRLELLRQFLTEDGSIWVTIDDHEGHYLKVVMDEIFGRQKFVATIAWQSRYSRSNDASISQSHNFIHVFAANPDVWKKKRNRLSRSEDQAKQYTNPDADPRGPWRAIPWDAPNIRENLSYPIVTPSGAVRRPPPGRCWSRTEDQWLQIVAEGLAYFGRNQAGAPAFKQFLVDAPKIVPNTWWPHEEAGHTDEAKKEGQALFGTGATFDTPKPERLMQRIIEIASSPGDVVLDSFLGSGTTAAVAHKMGRRYIGIENGDQATNFCAPRLRKVVEGELGGVSEAVDWQGGGGFTFYRLGDPVFDEDGRIRAGIKFPALAAHVWFSETGSALVDPATQPFLGVHDGQGYALLYNGILGDRRVTGGNVLTNALLASIRAAAGGYSGPLTIYGEATRISPARLKEERVTFKQTPYDVRAR